MRRIARQHRAALARRDLLVGIEAEDGQIAEAAGAAQVEARADGLAGVFNQRETVPARNDPERIDLSGNAEGVNGQDGACARSDCALHGGGVEVER